MHFLFCDELEYNSSLIDSSKSSPKKNHYVTSNGKLHNVARSKVDEQMVDLGVCERNGGIETRSILKNGNHFNYNDNYSSPTALQYQYNKPNNKANCMSRIIRPFVAEFVSVFLSIFIERLMENELRVHILTSNSERVILQALSNAAVTFMLVLAFQTVQLSPVITLAELFALTTAWPMCCMIVCIQIIASVAAIALFEVLRFGGIEMQMPVILQDVTMDQTAAAYHLVLSQFIGTLLVVTSHLLISIRTGSGFTSVARPGSNPLPLVAAVFISSLLCLLNSTIGWNPLVAFALAIYSSIGCDLEPLQKYGIFWIGPCLGSLFSCLLYRLLLTAKKNHLSKFAQ